MEPTRLEVAAGRSGCAPQLPLLYTLTKPALYPLNPNKNKFGFDPLTFYKSEVILSVECLGVG